MYFIYCLKDCSLGNSHFVSIVRLRLLFKPHLHYKSFFEIIFEVMQYLKLHFICVEKKNQLDVTECFIAVMIRSTCFGHLNAHHQELETICVLLLPMVCSAWLLVVGGQVQAAGCVSRKRDAALL